MDASLTHRTVGELVTENPGRARVFEQYGIDYCCGGKTALDHACRDRGVETDTIVQELHKIDESGPTEDVDWSAASLTDLADHIVTTHHAYLRTELPRLTQLVTKIADVHGGRRPELIEVREVFASLRIELEAHMMKEERILFPLIREMETSGCVAGHCGSVNNPIRVMEHEHDAAGAALAALRKLTADYTPPGDACNTYRATLHSLQVLETDMHTHIHKENNILFPRAAELEGRLTARSVAHHG